MKENVKRIIEILGTTHLMMVMFKRIIIIQGTAEYKKGMSFDHTFVKNS